MTKKLKNLKDGVWIVEKATKNGGFTRYMRIVEKGKVIHFPSDNANL